MLHLKVAPVCNSCTTNVAPGFHLLLALWSALVNVYWPTLYTHGRWYSSIKFHTYSTQKYQCPFFAFWMWEGHLTWRGHTLATPYVCWRNFGGWNIKWMYKKNCANGKVCTVQITNWNISNTEQSLGYAEMWKSGYADHTVYLHFISPYEMFPTLLESYYMDAHLL